MTDSVDSSNPPNNTTQHNGVNTEGRRASTVFQWEGRTAHFSLGLARFSVVLVIPQWDTVGTGHEQATKFNANDEVTTEI